MAGTSSIDLATMRGDYPLANTEACRMLAKALEQANEEKGWSQRSVAKMLNYKNSVALSHMAIGRVPIPVDRAIDFARLLKMEQSEFLIAVLQQRHPEIDFKRVLASFSKPSGKSKSNDSMLVTELEAISGVPMDELPVATINVLRDVVADKNGARRWMRMGEVPLIEHIRKSKPEGLSPSETKRLMDFIDAL